MVTWQAICLSMNGQPTIPFLERLHSPRLRGYAADGVLVVLSTSLASNAGCRTAGERMRLGRSRDNFSLLIDCFFGVVSTPQVPRLGQLVSIAGGVTTSIQFAGNGGNPHATAYGTTHH